MAGISSAIGWIAIAKQTAKGTLATAPTVKFKLSAVPSLAPTKNRGRYNVTDIGRTPGPGYTSLLAGGGGFQVYAEPSALALIWYLILGANADSGTTPNYTHTGTPGTDLPFCTIWSHVAGNITEKFGDCKLGSVVLEGTAGNPYTLAVDGIQAMSVVFGDTAADALAALAPAGYLFPETLGTAKFDTVTQKVHHLRVGVNNNTSPYQADDYFPSDIDVGKLEIEFACDTRYSSPTGAFPGYRREYYGGDSGTVLVPAVNQHAVDVTLTRNANLTNQFLLPQVTWTPSRPQPDPGGDPLETSIVATVETPSSGAIMTTVVKDQNASV
jgi:hypothetical protein